MGKKIDSVRYKKALDFAFIFYKGKYRKGISFPYFNYLSSVSNLIIENNGNTDEAIAGLIHDYFELENFNRKSNFIKNKFGVKIHNIIKQCSDCENDNYDNQNWINNKKKYLELMQKKSQSTLLVIICDKLHSVTCIINDHNKIGKKLWKNYEQSQKMFFGITKISVKTLKNI